MIYTVSNIAKGRFSNTQRREQLLLLVAAVFVAVTVSTLTVARQVSHIISTEFVFNPLLVWSLTLWLGACLVGHIGLQRLRPDRDAILFPVVMLLCGWGTVTIWRLQGNYALRQSVWICVGICAMLVTVRWFHWLRALQNYPYVALLFGALLTALTLIIGESPSGSGPRLWLGFDRISWFGYGVFLQPSELLKPLLVIFLAAYLSRHHTLLHLRIDGLARQMPISFLTPLLVMWGLSMFIVIVQRDLGAGWILYWGFLGIFFLGTRQWRYVVLGLALFLIGSALAYYASDLVRFRMQGWLNPWSDANGAYYQIVRSIQAMDSGGLLGAGIGHGAPDLIPLAHSDLIFPAIVNEWGKSGGVVLLLLSLIIVQRIARIGFSQRAGSYLQLLVLGVGVFVAVQIGVNIGGVTGVLPLTGVPLPFVSYGGSAMAVGFVELGFCYGCPWNHSK